jgi:hypothetical protein
VCHQCNSLRATTYIRNNGPCETETCRIVAEEERDTGVTLWKSALRTVCVHVYQVMTW